MSHRVLSGMTPESKPHGQFNAWSHEHISDLLGGMGEPVRHVGTRSELPRVGPEAQPMHRTPAPSFSHPETALAWERIKGRMSHFLEAEPSSGMGSVYYPGPGRETSEE